MGEDDGPQEGRCRPEVERYRKMCCSIRTIPFSVMSTMQEVIRLASLYLFPFILLSVVVTDLDVLLSR